jgi:hypothetical protein
MFLSRPSTRSEDFQAFFVRPKLQSHDLQMDDVGSSRACDAAVADCCEGTPARSASAKEDPKSRALLYLQCEGWYALRPLVFAGCTVSESITHIERACTRVTLLPAL